MGFWDSGGPFGADPYGDILPPGAAQQALWQGLLTAGGKLLDNAGPSFTPRGTFEGVGAAFTGGQNAAQDRALRAVLFKEQQTDRELGRDQTNLNMEATRASLERAARDDQRLTDLAAGIGTVMENPMIGGATGYDGGRLTAGRPTYANSTEQMHGIAGELVKFGQPAAGAGLFGDLAAAQIPDYTVKEITDPKDPSKVIWARVDEKSGNVIPLGTPSRPRKGEESQAQLATSAAARIRGQAAYDAGAGQPEHVRENARRLAEAAEYRRAEMTPTELALAEAGFSGGAPPPSSFYPKSATAAAGPSDKELGTPKKIPMKPDGGIDRDKMPHGQTYTVFIAGEETVWIYDAEGDDGKGALRRLSPDEISELEDPPGTVISRTFDSLF